MLVDIDRIVVGDRIRKDFGDLTDLTESIKKNGLIHPIAINKNYELLAGERRLRVCKSLGWDRIEAHMLDTESEEQDLAIEMDENNTRRNFTGSELAEGLRRQMEIESEKAKERMADPMQTFAEGQKGTARDKAAEQFGISGEQARKTLYVADNADLLDPADFAEWDEGKLSTNKAFQKIKAAQKKAEQERDDARFVAAKLKTERDDARAEIAALEKQNDELYELANTQQVVEREVVRTVAPEDYEDMKKRVRELEGSNRLYADDNKSLRKQLADAQDGAFDHERLMDAARLEADMYRRKYSELKELAGVIAAIDQFLSE